MSSNLTLSAIFFFCQGTPMFDESLITSAVCIECGACCSAFVRKDTTELVAWDERDVGEIEMVSCRHLDSRTGQHLCRQYQDRPQVCRQYHCLQKANLQGLEMPNTNVISSRVRAAVLKIHGRAIELHLSQSS